MGDSNRVSNKLTVFASGQGSLLEAIIDSGIKIELVLCDRPCRAISIAKQNGIKTELYERKDFTKSFNREAYSQEVLKIISEYKIDLIAMAGFMTILSADFFKNYQGVILNSHPALLPAFKGHDAVAQALRSGKKTTGCTIHKATAEVDSGEILAQAEVPILPGDTEATLHERIKQKERVLYPALLKKLLSNNI